jgi:uncharacterized membrane protein
VRATEAGYLQAVYDTALWRIGEGRHAGPVTIRMELHVGAFAFPGKPLASVWPADAADAAKAIREAFVLGRERTPEQDVEFGLVEIADIAVKALSPGINDPTTASHCIDRLTQLLAAIGSRRHPETVRRSPDGRVRLLVRDTPFRRAAGLAFDQIRHFGAANPTIAKKLLEALGDLAAVVPPDAREALAEQAEALARAARQAIKDPADLAEVERLTATVRADTAAPAGSRADAHGPDSQR